MEEKKSNELRKTLRNNSYPVKYIYNKSDLAYEWYYQAEGVFADILIEMGVSPIIANNPRVSCELFFIANKSLIHRINYIDEDNVDRVKQILQDIFEVDEKGQVTYNQIFCDRTIVDFFWKQYSSTKYCIEEEKDSVRVIEQRRSFEFKQDTKYAVYSSCLNGSNLVKETKVLPKKVSNGNYMGLVKTSINETSRIIDKDGIETEKKVISFKKYLEPDSTQKEQVLYPLGHLTDTIGWFRILDEKIDFNSLKRYNYKEDTRNPMLVSVDIYANYASDKTCVHKSLSAFRYEENFGTIDINPGTMKRAIEYIDFEDNTYASFFDSYIPTKPDKVKQMILKMIDEACCYGMFGHRTLSAMKRTLQSLGLYEMPIENRENGE